MSALDIGAPRPTAGDEPELIQGTSIDRAVPAREAAGMLAALGVQPDWRVAILDGGGDDLSLPIVQGGVEVVTLDADRSSDASQPLEAAYDLVIHRLPPSSGPEAAARLITSASGLLSDDGRVALAFDNPWAFSRILAFSPSSEMASTTLTGRARVAHLLDAQGLSQQRWLVAYPDIARPEVIVDAALWEHPGGGRLADLFVRGPVGRPPEGRPFVVDPLDAFQVASAAGLAADLADPLIVVASRRPLHHERPARASLLWSLPVAGLKREWQVIRELRLAEGGWILSPRGPIHRAESGPFVLRPVTVTVPVGHSGEDLLRSALLAGTPVPGVVDRTLDPFAVLQAWWHACRELLDRPAGDGHQYEIGPRRFSVTADGRWHHIADHLLLRYDVPPELLAFRALRELLSDQVLRSGLPRCLTPTMTLREAITTLLESIGVHVGEHIHWMWVDLEVDAAVRTTDRHEPRERIADELRKELETRLWSYRSDVPLDRQVASVLDGRDREEESRIHEQLDHLARENEALRRELRRMEDDLRARAHDAASADSTVRSMRLLLTESTGQLEHLRADSAWRDWQTRSRLLMGRTSREAVEQDALAIAEAGVFDADWYRSRNPDVVDAGMDPLLHFLLHGATEGRDPAPDFDVKGYVLRHADVRDTGLNPLIHAIQQDRRVADEPVADEDHGLLVVVVEVEGDGDDVQRNSVA